MKDDITKFNQAVDCYAEALKMSFALEARKGHVAGWQNASAENRDRLIRIIRGDIPHLNDGKPEATVDIGVCSCILFYQLLFKGGEG